jgi:hypothetical protein
MNVSDLPGPLFARITAGPNGCWDWTGRLTDKGYGHVYYQSSTQRAHRVTYELLVGQIPTGMELHHRCERESCVNPAHLEVCTTLYNVNQKADVNKGRCIRDHELTPENTRVQIDRRGHVHRSCKTCTRLRRAS